MSPRTHAALGVPRKRAMCSKSLSNRRAIGTAIVSPDIDKPLVNSDLLTQRDGFRMGVI